MTTSPELEKVARAEAAALMALVQHGIRTDIQSLLVTGDERGTVPPGALRAMVKAVRAEVLRSLLPVSDEAAGPIAYALTLWPEDSEAMAVAKGALTAAINHITGDRS